MQGVSGSVAFDLRELSQDEVSAALVEIAPDGILAMDASGRVASLNARAAGLLGCVPADIEGRSLVDLLRCSVRGDGMSWLRDVQGRGGFVDVCMLRADGSLASLQLAVRAIQFDGRVMFGCYLRENDDRSQRACAIASEPRGEAASLGVHPIVYVVDGDASLRTSLGRMLRHCGWRVESFAAGHAFLDHAHPRVPGCAVLDVELPDLDGFALHARMAADSASLPLILTTEHGDVPASVRAMKAGAFEFFTKPLSLNALLASVRDAIASSTLALEHAMEADALEARYLTLTSRERDVMRGVVSGLLNKQVAADLGISEITVKVHRGRVMRKMHAHSFAELVNLGAMLGSGGAAHAH